MKKRILVIDDNEDLLNMLQLILGKRGFEIEISENGFDGIKRASKFKPDLIILDIMMPEIDGYNTMRKIRSIKNIKPIIVMNTNLGLEKERGKAMKLGANFYINKSEYTLLETVNKIQEIVTKAMK